MLNSLKINMLILDFSYYLPDIPNSINASLMHTHGVRVSLHFYQRVYIYELSQIQ